MASKVFSVINLKGGTGKTTIAIGLAECLAMMKSSRVVVIDCDFQCTASIALVGRQKLNELVASGRTLDKCALQAVTHNDAALLRSCVVSARFAVAEAHHSVHLVAASPNMPRTEREILQSALGHGNLDTAYYRASVFIAWMIRTIAAEFDYAIIDCPPGITLFSEAAIRAADHIVVPTLPNEISIAAMSHLDDELERIRPNEDIQSRIVGAVVSKVRHRNATDHFRDQHNILSRLLSNAHSRFRLVEPYLPYCRELEVCGWREADTAQLTFAERYGSVANRLVAISKEILERSEAGPRIGAKAARPRHPVPA